MSASSASSGSQRTGSVRGASGVMRRAAPARRLAANSGRDLRAMSSRSAGTRRAGRFLAYSRTRPTIAEARRMSRSMVSSRPSRPSTASRRGSSGRPAASSSSIRTPRALERSAPSGTFISCAKTAEICPIEAWRSSDSIRAAFSRASRSAASRSSVSARSSPVRRRTRASVRTPWRRSARTRITPATIAVRHSSQTRARLHSRRNDHRPIRRVLARASAFEASAGTVQNCPQAFAGFARITDIASWMRRGPPRPKGPDRRRSSVGRTSPRRRRRAH